MQITKRSFFTGATHTMDIDLTESDMQRLLRGERPASFLGHLTQDELNFLTFGASPQECAERGFASSAAQEGSLW